MPYAYIVSSTEPLTHESSLELLSDINDNYIFSRWKHPDICGNEVSNVSLLLLGALRYIGRGFTFDDVDEATAISQEVIRKFSISF